MDIIAGKLLNFQKLVDEGMNIDNMLKALDIIGISGYDAETINSFKLWSDYMPRSDEYPYTVDERNLHILWESIDRVPLGINCAFAIPFRQIIAKKLFKRCGKGFIANEGCRFNFGNLIEIGDNVTWNHCCYIDSKGGVRFGDFAMMTEYCRIFTHSHNESDHMERTYGPVDIGDYAKIYTNCTILSNVKIGKGAVVATGAIVTHDVDDFTMVGGIPAKKMRERCVDKENLSALNHYTMKNKLFQNE